MYKNCLIASQCTETITGSTAKRSQDLESRRNLTYGPDQSYQNFYQKRWYRKLLLLIYLQSLAVAGDMVFTFGWLGLIQDLQSVSVLSQTAIFYALWFSLNLAIVWSYTILCLSLEDLVPPLKSPRTISPTVRWLRHKMSKAQLRCLQSIFWNGMILFLVGTSIAFDLWYSWYGGPG